MRNYVSISVVLNVFRHIQTYAYEKSTVISFRLLCLKVSLTAREKKRQGNYVSHQLWEVQCYNHILLLVPLLPLLIASNSEATMTLN